MNKRKFIKEFYKNHSKRKVLISINNAWHYISAYTFKSIPETEILLPIDIEISKIKFNKQENIYSIRYLNHNCFSYRYNDNIKGNISDAERIKALKMVVAFAKYIYLFIDKKGRLVGIRYDIESTDKDIEYDGPYLIDDDFDTEEVLFSKRYEDDDKNTILVDSIEGYHYHLAELPGGSKLFITLKPYAFESYGSLVTTNPEGYWTRKHISINNMLKGNSADDIYSYMSGYLNFKPEESMFIAEFLFEYKDRIKAIYKNIDPLDIPIETLETLKKYLQQYIKDNADKT